MAKYILNYHKEKVIRVCLIRGLSFAALKVLLKLSCTFLACMHCMTGQKGIFTEATPPPLDFFAEKFREQKREHTLLHLKIFFYIGKKSM